MILVSVLMPTYNHEAFIAQAINSFLEQQVCFDIELLIGDDCSSDNTPLIARTYAQNHPDKIHFFQYTENKGLMANYKYLLEQARGKYIAVLESDDVWIDPFKLQKQVERIEHADNCGLVFSNWTIIDYDSNEIARSKTPTDVVNYTNLLKENRAAAVTALFSKAMFDMYCNIDDYILLGFRTFDYPVWLSISAHSDVIYLEDYTAGYRHLATSISNTNNYQRALTFNHSIDIIVQYIVEKYGRGGLSKHALANAKTFRYLILALQFKKIRLAIKVAWLLHVVDIRTFVIKFFPWLWIYKNKKLTGTRNV
ncbi:glycosyltransferase [Butyricimonas paravirosa]|uniref:glycosyltransferase n=1 Tax=Butyricimonas paravirosa TaxID=1472417 RepID=UPI00210C2489|nr:glycosyltransferase [Butyricimonas paravirosa]MCQ4872556.1 glycosyltransferase [Butyricimonas paravirosa]